MKRNICLVSLFVQICIGFVCYCYGPLLYCFAAALASAGCIILAQWFEKTEK